MKKLRLVGALTMLFSATLLAEQHQHKMHGNHNMENASPMTQELMAGMMEMHDEMNKAMQYQDADIAFAAGMLPHHQGAVKMAEVELKYGKDPEMRKLAEEIIKAQQAEIELMQRWLKQHNVK